MKKVEDLIVGGEDAQGAVIVSMYAFKPPEYAVYRTAERVVIQFADDPALAHRQRNRMTRLAPLRGQINELVDDWRMKARLRDLVGKRSAHAHHDRAKWSVQQLKAERYDRRVGDALGLGLEDDVGVAEGLLADIRQDLLDERNAWARFEYLGVAYVTALLWVGLAWLVVTYLDLDKEGRHAWMGASAGAAGAFFSIALAIRGRTVLPTLQRAGNLMDAVLRILIGVIAAAVLIGLLISQAVDIAFGGASLSATGSPPWVFILIMGFIGGFSERFVPDLLTKVGGPAQAASTPTAPPAASEPDVPPEPPPAEGEFRPVEASRPPPARQPVPQLAE